MSDDRETRQSTIVQVIALDANTDPHELMVGFTPFENTVLDAVEWYRGVITLFVRRGIDGRD